MQVIWKCLLASKPVPMVIVVLLLQVGCVSLEGVEPATIPAQVVQANYRLWQPVPCKCNYPAVLVFSLDPAMSHDDLQRLASLTFSLKGKQVADPGLQFLAGYVTDETYRGDSYTRLPASLGFGGETFISEMMIDRTRLSKGYLSHSELWLDVWVVDGKPRKVTLKSD